MSPTSSWGHPSQCLLSNPPHAKPHRQLVLVTPDACALPLLNHSLDVHQHGQRHTARGKAAEQRAGAAVTRTKKLADRQRRQHTVVGVCLGAGL